MNNMSPIPDRIDADEDLDVTHRPVSLDALYAASTEASPALAARAERANRADGAMRKPRVALMGEFSAGKSTLTNLLMGCRPLPERVTATRLSPVWISKGTGGPRRVRLDGQEEPVSVENIGSVPIEGTRMIRLFLDKPPILDFCDLIDFPGISDPNMDSEVWERLLPEVDMILWCTHATQAWRQSEAAVWDMVPEAVRERSLLVVTRFDKLNTERDRNRVLNRLRHETGDLFDAMFPVSLLQALKAGSSDAEAWVESGAGPFSDHLIQSLRTFTNGDAAQQDEAGDEAVQPEAVEVTVPPTERIIPRRIRPVLTATRRARPTGGRVDDREY